MAVKKIVLLACGSYNPPTIMHLRMFEIARDHLEKLGMEVLFGIMSPVHDAYAKKELISSTHRSAMLNLALYNSNWIKVSDWECSQEGFMRTAVVLKHHQNQINSIIKNKLNDNVNEQDISWMSNIIQHIHDNVSHVQVKLLCGGDLLESFGVPGLWTDEDIENIVGNHGLVVVTRANSNPYQFIYMSDVLTKYMSNIIVVTEWIKNDISSTKIRRALRRRESVKYLVSDSVLDYIMKCELYGWTTCNNKYLYPPISKKDLSLTPSPVDMSMDSPSPTNPYCMSICNNNLFSSRRSSESYPPIDGQLNKTNIMNAFKHPGQAVKIITDSHGEHTIVKDSEGNVTDNEVREVVERNKSLKTSLSCTNFETLDARWSLQGSKSNDDLKGYKSCDENLIKFIFTKHGIQVISDIETIV